MSLFSYDIVSTYDKAEMNNVFDLVRREISSRYDFKGSTVGVEWLADKKGLVITATNEWQVDTVIDILRKKLAGRAISSKVLDLSRQTKESNLRAAKEVPFVDGLSQEKSKKIVSILKDNFPKIKTQITGDSVRVSSPSKNELQETMACITSANLEFTTAFINYR